VADQRRPAAAARRMQPVVCHAGPTRWATPRFGAAAGRVRTARRLPRAALRHGRAHGPLRARRAQDPRRARRSTRGETARVAYAGAQAPQLLRRARTSKRSPALRTLCFALSGDERRGDDACCFHGPPCARAEVALRGTALPEDAGHAGGRSAGAQRARYVGCMRTVCVQVLRVRAPRPAAAEPLP
jgi:hypothetical protein